MGILCGKPNGLKGNFCGDKTSHRQLLLNWLIADLPPPFFLFVFTPANNLSPFVICCLLPKAIAWRISLEFRIPRRVVSNVKLNWRKLYEMYLYLECACVENEIHYAWREKYISSYSLNVFIRLKLA